MTTINTGTLAALATTFEDDRQMLEAICDACMAFETYHQRVFAMETMAAIYSPESLGAAEYRDAVSAADQARTSAHNNVLAKVQFLNRCAAQKGLPPVYDGVVSKDQPYRRQVADAVFEYVQSIIVARP